MSGSGWAPPQMPEPTPEPRRRTVAGLPWWGWVLIAGAVVVFAVAPSVDLPDADADRGELSDRVVIRDLRCGADEVTGRVANNNDVRVDIFIDVVLLDRDGVQVADRTDWVRGLRPGGVAEWDVAAFEPFANCRARISSVFADD